MTGYKLLLLFCASGALLCACKGYEVTLNEREIYKPAPALTQFHMADNNLQTCIDQTIKDKNITAVAQLTQLSCTHAGINDLSGLSYFSALEALNLADNDIQAIEPLAKLSKLKVLRLENNRIQGTDAVLSLLQLQTLDLRGNPALACDELARLVEQSPADISLPQHCANPTLP
ncbi:hypothetical protein QWY82_16700 [Simiduia curdlanivorans]|uniref:Leucine-rich repeat domain-containing protein n=1 Tax=Simiduia curdlanivorans TaxID=1492769 RepID=A0ABV8V081_9GAMM|nr:leucine-rich repeat domain-containing protein [Simiduia curdlanivorans]MDN3640437.1 hypothetical protein [Simiduia curdlanivorans]